jgi:hypothetical protein
MIALSLVFLLLGSDRTSTERNRLRATVAAAALVEERFETVFYANADLLLSTGRYKQLSEQSANTLRLPFADLIGGLESLGPHASADLLSKADAVLIGARDFRPPATLGDVQSQFCYVVVLAGDNTSILARTTKLPGVSEEEGSVWKWAAKPTEGSRSPAQYYATQVGGSYLVITSNLDGLRLMAQKLASSKGGTSPPLAPSIRDWEAISQHEVWGYRNYYHNEAENNKEAAGTSEIMSDAQALAFFVDLKQQVGVLRLYSSAADTPHKINAKHMLPSLDEVNTGLWEAKVSLSGDQTLQPMVNVMGLFGFAIYL